MPFKNQQKSDSFRWGSLTCQRVQSLHVGRADNALFHSRSAVEHRSLKKIRQQSADMSLPVLESWTNQQAARSATVFLFIHPKLVCSHRWNAIKVISVYKNAPLPKQFQTAITEHKFVEQFSKAQMGRERDVEGHFQFCFSFSFLPYRH